MRSPTHSSWEAFLDADCRVKKIVTVANVVAVAVAMEHANALSARERPIQFQLKEKSRRIFFSGTGLTGINEAIAAPQKTGTGVGQHI